MTQNKTQVTITITGGHLTPALAVMEEIKLRYPAWHMVFVGRKTSLEGSSARSEEREMVEKLGVEFLPITAGRIKRDLDFHSILAFLKIPVGFFQSARYIIRIKPRVIVSFGGYVAFPVAMMAYFFGIPVVTHEQTTRPGLANRIIAKIAKKVAVNFPDIGNLGVPEKLVVTGLPIRKILYDPPKTSSIRITDSHPLVLIVGGSTGSVSINEVVFKALPKLLNNFTVIHQVGRLSETNAFTVKKSLDSAIRDRYFPVVYLSSDFYAWALKHAACVVGRSGANTVTEVAATGAIALWIPLPWAARNEQYHNAKFLEKQGTSLIIEQSSLTPDALCDGVVDLLEKKDERKKAAARLSHAFPRDSARRFVDLLSHVISS